MPEPKSHETIPPKASPLDQCSALHQQLHETCVFNSIALSSTTRKKTPAAALSHGSNEVILLTQFRSEDLHGMRAITQV